MPGRVCYDFFFCFSLPNLPHGGVFLSRYNESNKDDLSYFTIHKSKHSLNPRNPELIFYDESLIEDEYFENNRGCIRVKKVRDAYFGGFISDSKLEELYLKWRNTREDIWLDGYDSQGDFVKTCFVKASKRGNDVYKHLVSKKFGFIDSLPPIHFFEEDTIDKRTPMIFITLTVDTKKYSKKQAWKIIADELNQFETRLRQLVTGWLKKLGINKKGSFVSLKSNESHESGYPHIHGCYCFNNWEFIVFDYYNKDGELEYRIPDKYADEIKKLWRMGVNVKIQGVQDTLGAFSEIRKYITKDIFAPKGVKTCCMLWVHRKKAYSISKCNPYEDYLDLIHGGIEKRLKPDFKKCIKKDFIGAIWGKDVYLKLYNNLLCGGLAEPNTTGLVAHTVYNYNKEVPEIVFWKFRGAIKHDDLARFLEKVPDDWSFLINPPPNVDAEMRFFFGVDTPFYDSISDIEG